MSVPTSVQSLLNKQNVHYQVSEVPVTENERALWHDQHLRTMCAAKSVILQDTKGRVQVIYAADRLLDLKAVNRHLGRELHAAARDKTLYPTIPAFVRTPATVAEAIAAILREAAEKIGKL